MSGGELFEKIMEDESLMSESEVRDYMHQILLGVQHMHKNDIVHLDLKVCLPSPRSVSPRTFCSSRRTARRSRSSTSVSRGNWTRRGV